MADVVDLDVHRHRSATARERDRVGHPMLRWVAGRTFYVAHRKTNGTAACGARGSLMLATPGVPECTVCFPPDEVS